MTQAAATCSYTLAPTSSGTVAAGGDSGPLTLSTRAGCAWTATSDVSWTTVTPASGTGPETLTYTVAPNPSPSSRSGTVTVGGQVFAVTQAAATCSYTLAPTSVTVQADGETGDIAITASPGCAWTATSSKKWLSVTPAVGSGSGTLSYTAAQNKSAKSRTTTLHVEGQTVTVTQQRRPKRKNAGDTEATWERRTFTTVADFSALWHPGEGHALVLGPSSLKRGYAVEVSPLDPARADVEAFVQPEFDGSEWNDVLRVTPRSSPGLSPVDADIRVYRVVAPTVLDIDAALQPGQTHRFDLGPSASDARIYVPEISPLGPSIEGAYVRAGSCGSLPSTVRTTCAAVDSEFDGTTWRAVLRVQYSAGSPAVNANIRVYDVTTAPSVTEFDYQLQPGVLHGVILGSPTLTQGNLVNVTPVGPSAEGAVVETFVRPEFHQGTWVDVIRLRHSSNQSERTADVRTHVDSLAPLPDQVFVFNQNVHDSITLPIVTAQIRAYSIPPVPAAAHIAALSQDVEELVAAGSLDVEQGVMLTGLLEEVLSRLAQDQSEAVVNLFRAFINDVSVAVTTGVLTAAGGQLLINATSALISQIERGDADEAAAGASEFVTPPGSL